VRPDNRVQLVIPCAQLAEVFGHELEMLAPPQNLFRRRLD
jgi:hypothetical protein